MSIDPYLVRIPRSIINSLDQELIEWYIYDNQWKHAVWRNLGGGSNNIAEAINEASSNQDQIDFLVTQLSDALSRIEDLESQIEEQNIAIDEWISVDASSAYTADDGQEINASLGAVITMPTSGKVKVNNVDGSLITVNFSQNIFGDTQVIISNYGSVVFKYLPDSDEWVFE